MGVSSLFGTFLSFIAGQMIYFWLHLESSSFPRPLTPKEERECLQRMQDKDPKARDMLIRHNLRLVAHVVKKYYPGTADTDDLISIGTIGLIKAVSSFRPEKKARFSTYAAKCIENAILSQKRKGTWRNQKGLFHVPLSIQDKELLQIGSGKAARIFGNLFRSSDRDDLSAGFSAAGAQIDNIVGI